MIARFCLYGFLKNQRYFEPFLILVFLEKGLTFLQIGLLIGFREVCVNLFELPSGAVADVYGRRRSMIASFSAYLVSFLVFAAGGKLWSLFAAMLCFALGEAFRSGTHKAMIFDWLALHGRSGEKARVYGTTRSWSQLGSAVSVLIAALIVIFEGHYSRVFLYSTVPYALGLVNLFGYPAALDGKTGRRPSLAGVVQHLARTLRTCMAHAPLRRLLTESMAQRGLYVTVKDYLQPVLRQTALALPVFLALDDKSRAAVLVGVVYFALHLLSALASRLSHRTRELAGGTLPATRGLWLLTLLLYLLLIPALAWAESGLVIAVFVALAMLQNLWKPQYLARVDEASDAALGATVLSLDNQAKSVLVMVLAPLLGAAVDRWGLAPLGVLGAAAAAFVLIAVLPQRTSSIRS